MRAIAGLLAAIGLSVASGGEPGPDFSGGTKLVYQIVAGPGVNTRSDYTDPTIAESVVKIITRRLDLYGLKKFDTTINGDRISFRVSLPARSEELLQVRRQIETAGKLEFVLVAPDDQQTPARIAEVEAEEQKYLAAVKAWAEEKKKFEDKRLSEGQTAGEFTSPQPREPKFIARPEVSSEMVNGATKIIEKPQNKWGNRMTVLQNDPQSVVSGRYIIRAGQVFDESGKPAVSFGLNKQGAERLAELTGSNSGRLLSIVLDDQILNVANIRSRISDQGQLSGNYTRQDTRSIVAVLKGGSLPAKLKLIEESAIEAK